MARPLGLFPPRGWARYHPKLHEVKSNIFKYFGDLPQRPKGSNYTQALDRALRDFSLPTKINPLHINDSINYFKNVDRSPGLPYTLEGFKRKDEVPPNRIKQYVHNLKYNVYTRCNTPCTSAVKTVVSKKRKFRSIWVYPAHMTFAEGMFASPLIQAYIEKRGPYALWLNYAKGDMRYLMSQRSPACQWLGTDWTNYDATVPAWLIRDAFEILRAQMDFSRYYEWGVPTDPDTLPRLWDRIIYYFINTPMRFQDGLVVRKRQGVPSGSYFTNLIDSVVNAIVWHYLLPGHRGKRFYVGDDALLELSKHEDLSVLAKTARDTFGFNLNTDKSSIGTHVSFLGYTMGRDGRPMADYDKLMAQLTIPSRPDKSFEDFCSRARALQLSCFGSGCWEFTYEVQAFLDDHAPDFRPSLHSKDDLMVKLVALDLADWPPLTRVIQMV